MPRGHRGPAKEPLEAACRQYEGTPSLVSQTVDVGDLASVEKLFDWSKATMGPLDILVNSAWRERAPPLNGRARPGRLGQSDVH